MVFKVNTSKRKFYRHYVNTINAALGLSNRELDILAVVFELDINWNKEEEKNVIGTGSRKEIQAMTLVNRHNLSRYITVFKNKNIIVNTGDDKWEVNKYLLPELNPTVKVLFELNIGDY